MNTFLEDNENIIENKTIYLDTSAAMHFKGFGLFVKQNEGLLENVNNKIIVLKAVWLELIRNYNSRDKRKAEAANKAIEIISNHRNIFEIEDEEIFQYEMEHAFADKVILSSMILKRTDSSILLITNDKMLSKDAIEINNQSSCRGYQIRTCFISDNGHLLPGFCDVKDMNALAQKDSEKEIKGIMDKDENSFSLSWESFAIPIGTLFLGFAIGKYSNHIRRVISTTA